MFKMNLPLKQILSTQASPQDLYSFFKNAGAFDKSVERIAREAFVIVGENSKKPKCFIKDAKRLVDLYKSHQVFGEADPADYRSILKMVTSLSQDFTSENLKTFVLNLNNQSGIIFPNDLGKNALRQFVVYGDDTVVIKPGMEAAFKHYLENLQKYLIAEEKSLEEKRAFYREEMQPLCLAALVVAGSPKYAPPAESKNNREQTKNVDYSLQYRALLSLAELANDDAELSDLLEQRQQFLAAVHDTQVAKSTIQNVAKTLADKGINATSLTTADDELYVQKMNTWQHTYKSDLEVFAGKLYSLVLGPFQPDVKKIMDTSSLFSHERGDGNLSSGILSSYKESFQSWKSMEKQGVFSIKEDQYAELANLVVASLLFRERDLHYGNLGYIEDETGKHLIKIDHDQSLFDLQEPNHEIADISAKIINELPIINEKNYDSPLDDAPFNFLAKSIGRLEHTIIKNEMVRLQTDPKFKDALHHALLKCSLAPNKLMKDLADEHILNASHRAAVMENVQARQDKLFTEALKLESFQQFLNNLQPEQLTAIISEYGEFQQQQPVAKGVNPLFKEKYFYQSLVNRFEHLKEQCKENSIETPAFAAKIKILNEKIASIDAKLMENFQDKFGAHTPSAEIEKATPQANAFNRAWESIKLFFTAVMSFFSVSSPSSVDEVELQEATPPTVSHERSGKGEEEISVPEEIPSLEAVEAVDELSIDDIDPSPLPIEQNAISFSGAQETTLELSNWREIKPVPIIENSTGTETGEGMEATRIFKVKLKQLQPTPSLPAEQEKSSNLKVGSP
ncbi:hypothetical protein [Legionella septentrionalis]|uniref:LepB N-terminal domain-containing protein n=1 Tax=Legionella septentrionalis TaxID=2498109 RepID=A0A433JLW9_9GAMM|nr:hypothetical protein [Legionella septentrionalis]RUQ90419.1 hypothetical protein EKM59_02095 [Legionella septentrionalis]RUR00070.1 hypothetical protein ELY11_03460 [Legionella septentrionalis]RUR10766.1 hypothetical protein ELY14_04295 [Legionella septentrionalis]RUR16481.1 hypothetical protein ELY10_03030 [Legionella septentrionalis]